VNSGDYLEATRRHCDEVARLHPTTEFLSLSSGSPARRRHRTQAHQGPARVHAARTRGL